jgi:cell shape-determining protein MreD
VIRWTGPLFVVLLGAVVPLCVPPGLRDAGLWPEFAVLSVVVLGFRATPERAALFGVVTGFAASLWSPEPLCFRPFVLGAVGFLAGQVASVLTRESTVVRMCAAALGVLALRVAERIAAALASGPSADWTGAEAARAVGTVVLAAAVAGLAAPAWFAFVRRSGLLAPFERSFRDV